MTSEEKHPILETLKYLGFQGQGLEKEVVRYIKLGHPQFTISHRLTVDGEQMFFTLFFERTNAKMGLELRRYDAVLFAPSNIVHMVIGDIDTRHLERRMEAVNWNSPPDEGRVIEFIHRICDDLIRLKEQSSHGNYVQKMLRFKFWWGTPYEGEEIKKFPEHQKLLSKSFINELPDVDTCYKLHFKLSDTRNFLLSSLRDIGVNQVVLVDRKLKNRYPEDFNLEYSSEYEEGVVQYNIPVHWNGKTKTYTLQNYEASLSLYKPIEHSTFNGINTAELERQMVLIDWQDEASHYRLVDDEPQFTEAIDNIVTALQYDLPVHPEGKQISDRLQARYWSASPDFAGIMDNSAWDYLNATIKSKAIFPPDVHTASAMHLLCGRAVCLKWGDPRIDNSATWLRIATSSANQGWGEVKTLPGFNFMEVERLLDHLPAGQQEKIRSRDELLFGMRSSITLLSGQTLEIETVPEKGTFHFFTVDGAAVDSKTLIGLGWSPALLPDNTAAHLIAGAQKNLSPKTRRPGKGNHL